MISIIRSSDLSKARGHSSEVEKQLNDAKATIEKCLRDYDALLARTQKVRFNRSIVYSFVTCSALFQWLFRCRMTWTVR